MSLKNMPVIPLRGLTVFPNMVMSFPIGRKLSLDAVDEAQVNDERIFLVPQTDSEESEPDLNSLSSVGTICKIKQVLKLPANVTHVIVEGLNRAYVENLNMESGYFKADADIIDDCLPGDFEDDLNAQALMRLANEEFEKYNRLNSVAPSSEAMLTLVSSKTPGQTADAISAGLNINNDLKLEILETIDEIERIKLVIDIIKRELVILELKNEIDAKVKKNVDDSQREYYLREQLKVIGEELGDKDGIQGIKEDFIKRANKKNLPDNVYKTVIDECERMAKIPVASPEFNVARTYIECVLKLPWSEKSEENLDIKTAKKILNDDHYGLEDVKERILQFIAVRMNTNKPSASIICLAGPPGVGKTSIAKSVAKATGRKYVRMSLGGVKDEAEIRGHRRTYVGAMWGRILNAMKDAGTTNPLMLLDEIDKLGNSYNGDPSSALLEVLDPEQNNTFTDHYLDMPYDLSDVLFICTANDISQIPGPLRDRMEIIQLTGYLPDEKKNIALKYLCKKQFDQSGLSPKQISISEKAIEKIIDSYTREAGVRQLERTIGTICRKTVVNVLSGKKTKTVITEKNIENFLGPEKFSRLKANPKPLVGVVRGLAWTSVGGDTLEIEANIMKGNGHLDLTGNMGNVMKESARAGITYIRANAEKFNIANQEFYKDTDIHIHIPEGAVPKDGPSAGITMALAVLSALTGAKIKSNVAMTGEVTLRGRVLPIGGLKEKVTAAKQAGIDTILIPFENKPNLEEIPKNIRDGITFIPVETMKEVIDNAVAEGEKIWK